MRQYASSLSCAMQACSSELAGVQRRIFNYYSYTSLRGCQVSACIISTSLYVNWKIVLNFDLHQGPMIWEYLVICRLQSQTAAIKINQTKQLCLQLLSDTSLFKCKVAASLVLLFLQNRGHMVEKEKSQRLRNKRECLFQENVSLAWILCTDVGEGARGTPTA